MQRLAWRSPSSFLRQFHASQALARNYNRQRKPRSPKPKASVHSQGVLAWANNPEVHDRLEGFGIPRDELQPLLQRFVDGVFDGEVSDLRHDLLTGTKSSIERRQQADVMFSSAFIHSSSALQPNEGISEETLALIDRLAQGTDLSHPSEWYPLARQMRRKIIMHVGPTNSGKTHNALRALAAAKRGLYAGPLRLLAHEIWERLNLGQITPKGVDDALVHQSSTVESSALDDGKPTVRKDFNKAYVRPCNLITGEEKKIVDDHAPLLSCTVEMAPIHGILDVAVIDEIQMISNPERGNAWTTAVLGIPAHEVHLCGEETAVPIIEEMVKETGDELIINRYQRLSPLTVEDESLNMDFTKIQKGDCVVTFSRKGIHRLKQQIERSTGLKCAVAYGKLPPEIRSEQAALFNDPDSGYDVIIGSDALGMGLNLKIKRIVFETLTKWDGENERPLSVSQVKQIAGRAGRYGERGSGDTGGTVTTLSARDLPALREYLAKDAPVLPFARISAPHTPHFYDLVSALPARSSTTKVYSALTHLSKLRTPYAYAQYPRLQAKTEVIDRTMKSTMDLKAQIMNAPIAWRDDIAMDTFQRILKRYGDGRDITVDTLLSNSECGDALKTVEGLMDKPGHPARRPYELLMLESLHNILVFYMWMSFRNPVAFHDHVAVQDLKTRTELALEYCLEGLSEADEKAIPKGEPLATESVADSILDQSQSSPAWRRNKPKKIQYESVWDSKARQAREMVYHRSSEHSV